jgi:hypothetical protein
MQPLARIAFQGLWSIADREGRLEYQPKEIKLYTVPHDDVEIDDLLEEIRVARLIVFYQVDSRPLIWIPRFKVHQPLHWHEKESELPAFQQDSLIDSIKTLHRTLQGSCNRVEVEVEVEVEERVRVEIEEEVEKGKTDKPPDSVDEFVEKYREICQPRGLKKVLIVNNSRKSKIRQRLKELAEASVTIEEYMQKIADSPFLRGERGDWDSADFDFIIGAENIGKILDGKYDKREQSDPLPDVG